MNNSLFNYLLQQLLFLLALPLQATSAPSDTLLPIAASVAPISAAVVLVVVAVIGVFIWR